MSKKLTTEEFIQKSKLIHHNKYNYSKVQYINSDTKVCIICHLCHLSHEFWQTPYQHVNRHQGCPVYNDTRKTNNDFIIDAQKIHKNKYEYINVNYINNQTKINIICKKHKKEFWQRPQDHLAGRGCPICSHVHVPTNEEFIEKAIQIHENKYDYININYINNKTNINIICPIHGKFLQAPSNHLKGSGCPKCKKSKGEKQIEKWLNDNNIKFISQKTFFNCNHLLPLRFDFYLLNYNLIIEYDGGQHFFPINYWGGEQGFQKIQLHDQIKNQYCLDHNIPLLRIPYWNFKNIDKILDRLKNNNFIL